MIKFQVAGIPAPKGSAKAFMPKGARFPIVTHDNPKTKPWEQAVRAAAHEAGCRGDYVGPVWVRVEFLFPRIKGDFSASGAIKVGAPTKHTKKPDLDKLCRALLDGLIGTAMADDSQVVGLVASKRYARITEGEVVGALVEIEIAEVEAVRPRQVPLMGLVHER